MSWQYALIGMCVLLGTACFLCAKWDHRYQRPMAEPHHSCRRNGPEACP